MKQLQESEIRYRRLFEAAKDGILILDAETGKIVDANPFLLQLLGYSYDALHGQYIWDLGAFRDIAASKEAFKVLQENDYIRYEDLPLETHDGHLVSVEVVSNVYLVDNARVIQCNIRDITQRKQSDENLRLSEQTYRGILDSITDSVYIQDANGIFIDVNLAAETMWGYTKAEFIGKNQEFLSAPGKNDLAKFALFLEKSLLGEPQSFEFQGQRKAGTIFPVDVVLNLGNYFGKKVVIAVSRDITERKAIEQLLNDVQRRESIGVLSSGIAHDFNNLLAVMMGNVTIAQTHLDPAHPAAKNMDQALTAMNTAAELVQQILAYSGKGKYQIRTIDLGREVEEHISLFKVSMSKNVSLVTELPSTPVYISGDHAQIKQTIMNLIINGGDAIGEMHGVVTVKLEEVTLEDEQLQHYCRFTNTTLNAGRYARLDVSDNGIGMSQQTIDRIFDPFFTTKFVGRGLGLAAVLGIIRGHKGGIALESAEGVGTTFSVILPLAPVPESVITAPAETLAPVLPAATTVLVIDDEPGITMMAREMLESRKYTVLTEENPVAGIALYERHRTEIGVVLLDLTMPEMSGKEVAEALHAIDPEVKIILTSGYSEEDIKNKIDMANVTGFIQKPYTLRGLAAVVGRAVQTAAHPAMTMDDLWVKL